jgi:hypothetical protein
MPSGISNADAFALDLREAGRKLLPAEVALVRDRLTLGVHRRVVLASPVDTGFHRASWNASIGAPDESLPAEGAESYPAPDTPGGLGGGGAEPYAAGYVTNAGPAITRLNEGHSQQAPAHFVQRAIEEELSSVRGGTP